MCRVGRGVPRPYEKRFYGRGRTCPAHTTRLIYDHPHLDSLVCITLNFNRLQAKGDFLCQRLSANTVQTVPLTLSWNSACVWFVNSKPTENIWNLSGQKAVYPVRKRLFAPKLCPANVIPAHRAYSALKSLSSGRSTQRRSRCERSTALMISCTRALWAKLPSFFSPPDTISCIKSCTRLA